jgi:hypothetical protein
VKQEIDHPSRLVRASEELIEKLGGFWPHAGKICGGGEERVEQAWAHGRAKLAHFCRI